MLVPSPLPPLELTSQRLPRLRLTTGLAKVPMSFPATKTAVTIPAHITATLLLDQTFLTTAYPRLVFSGGQGAGLSLGCAKGLYVGSKEKGSRNKLAGKYFLGRRDSKVPSTNVIKEKQGLLPSETARLVVNQVGRFVTWRES